MTEEKRIEREKILLKLRRMVRNQEIIFLRHYPDCVKKWYVKFDGINYSIYSVTKFRETNSVFQSVKHNNLMSTMILKFIGF